MISRPYRLEEFDLTSGNNAKEIDSEPVLEKEKLDAFDQGYRAGWDDATAAQQQDQTRIASELENSFKDLSFTFHEAKAHILQSIEPLIKEMVNKIFPDLAKENLPQIVSERLLRIFQDATERPITISVSTESRIAVESALPSDPGFPISIKEEQTLGPGQVFINLGASEEVLDLDSSLNSMRLMLTEFFEANKMDRKYG